MTIKLSVTRRTVGVSILVLAALCLAPAPAAAQFCGVPPCITVTNPSNPAGVSASFQPTTTGVSVNILYDPDGEGPNPGSINLNGSGITTDSTIEIKANTAVGVEPRVVLSSGFMVERWDTAANKVQNGDGSWTVTIKVKPRAVSYTAGTCNPFSCDTNATNDFPAMAIVTISSMEEAGIDASFRTAANGAYISTSGQYFSNPSSTQIANPNNPNAPTTVLQFQVGAPHCKAAGTPDPGNGCPTSELNKTGAFQFRAPAGLIALLGTDAATLAQGSSVTVGGASQPIKPPVQDSDGGLTFESDTPLFSFSTPTVQVSKAAAPAPGPIVPANLTISPTTAVLPPGPTNVIIRGSGFLTGAGVRVNGESAIDATVINSERIEAVLPVLVAGVAEVIVINPNGQIASVAGGFTYPLTLTAISPTSGPMGGGTAVTLTGSYFGAGETVRLGGAALASLAVQSLTSIVATTRPRSAGTVDVVITTLTGQSVTLANAFTYNASDLTITKTGTGTGSVSSSPAGILCGSDCTEKYTSLGNVTLKASPDSDSTFVGWGGDADCSDGVVSLDASRSCTATFVRQPDAAPVDLGTDGLADVFTYHPTTGVWSMETGSGQGAFAARAGAWPANLVGRAGTWSPDWLVRAADFNADKRADMFLYNFGTGTWFRAINDGLGGFTYVTGTWAAGWNTYVVDLDGDGKSDVFLYNPLTGQWFKCLTVGAGEFSYVTGAWPTGREVYPVEWNGDGRADFFLYHGSTGDWLHATNDGGTGFTQLTGSWSPNWGVYVGDFDGNGRSDIFLYNLTTGQYFVATSTGTSFTYVTASFSPNLTIRVLDLDADGRADVFLYNFATGAWQEAFNNGVGGFTLVSGSWSPSWRLFPTDFDGNKRGDLLLYNTTTGTWFQAINTGAGLFKYGTGSWHAGLAIVASR